MSRQRWLVLATCVRPGGRGGGVVRYTRELVAALQRRDDVEVTVLGEAASRPALLALVGGDEQRVRTLPVPLPGAAGALVERLHPVAAHGFDVVLGTKHVLPARSSALRMLTVHDLLLFDRPGDFPALKRRLLPGVYRRSIASADVPLCVSAATQARLAAYDPAAADRSVVVPLASASALRRTPPEPVDALAGRRFALVVGDGSPRKNLRTVAAAWDGVRDRVPGAVLAIAGPPDWSRSAVDDHRAALVASGAAVALGHLPEAQLRWCYEQAAVVLCPSIAEGFGLPVAEALDLGAPVVVSDDRALGEVAAGRQRATVRWDEVAAWTRAAADALAAPRRSGAYVAERRDWDGVAADTVAAARAAQGRARR